MIAPVPYPLVLVLLFAFCITAIVWAFWPLDQATLFERGARLMASSRLSDMNEAWRDYLDPLRVFAALEGRPFEPDGDTIDP